MIKRFFLSNITKYQDIVDCYTVCINQRVKVLAWFLSFVDKQKKLKSLPIFWAVRWRGRRSGITGKISEIESPKKKIWQTFQKTVCAIFGWNIAFESKINYKFLGVKWRARNSHINNRSGTSKVKRDACSDKVSQWIQEKISWMNRFFHILSWRIS